jgi:hypothetical protein
MIRVSFRKPSEITKGEWIDTVDLIGVGIAIVFFLSILMWLIPAIYKTSSDFPKITFGLFIILGIDCGVKKLLQKIWGMQKYRGMPHSKADEKYNKRFENY